MLKSAPASQDCRDLGVSAKGLLKTSPEIFEAPSFVLEFCSYPRDALLGLDPPFSDDSQDLHDCLLPVPEQAPPSHYRPFPDPAYSRHIPKQQGKPIATITSVKYELSRCRIKKTARHELPPH